MFDYRRLQCINCKEYDKTYTLCKRTNLYVIGIFCCKHFKEKPTKESKLSFKKIDLKHYTLL